MTDTYTVKVAGPYTVISNAQGWLECNGVVTSMVLLDKPFVVGDASFVALVDTKCYGANGRKDQVGLTRADLDALLANSKRRMQERQAKYAAEHAEEIAEINRLARLRDEHDRIYNEGGDGFNPYTAQIERLLRGGAAAGAADLRDEDHIAPEA